MSHINPAFDNFPREEAIIGRMILAFGELEYSMMALAGTCNGELTNVMKALYRLRSSSSRMDAADALIQPLMKDGRREGEYGVALGAIRYCQTIRNIFSHCTWASDPSAGIFYTNVQEFAEINSYRHYEWRHVDEELLKQQEAFFANARDWMRYLHSEAMLLRGFGTQNVTPKPPSLLRPTLHNSPETHARPSMFEDKTGLHVRTARETGKVSHLPQQKLDPEKPTPPEGSG